MTLGALALAACAVLHASPAAAQSQSAQRCTTIDDDAERLACYDRALRPAPAPPAAPATATVAPAPASAPAAATPPAVAPPNTAIATENRATRREREVRESTASAAPAAPPAPAARHAPAADRDAAVDSVPIVIVQVRALPGRAATFVTDTGEIWIQTDSQRQLPAAPFKAAIRPGSMSSFFLVPENYARSFRVRRGQ